MINKETYIIVLNFNGYNDTIECVQSILNSYIYSKLKIIIVDNNSNDNSYQKLKTYFKKNKLVYILKNNVNNGYANGNNIGIKYALDKKADYIWILNNDVIIEKYTIKYLIEAYERHNKAFFGTIVYDYNNNKISYFGASVDKKFHVKYFTDINNLNKSVTVDLPTDFLCGVSIFAHRSLWEKYKLPEEYFLYEEDLDFSLKLKQDNIPMYIVADAKIYHKESVSTNKLSYIKYYYLQRNKLMLINKYAKNPWKTCFFIKKFFIFPFRTIRRLIKGIFLNREYIYYTKYECKAFYDFLRGKVGKFDD